jgi:hypothetical protein
VYENVPFFDLFRLSPDFWNARSNLAASQPPGD